MMPDMRYLWTPEDGRPRGLSLAFIASVHGED